MVAQNIVSCCITEVPSWYHGILYGFYSKNHRVFGTPRAFHNVVTLLSVMQLDILLQVPAPAPPLLLATMRDSNEKQVFPCPQWTALVQYQFILLYLRGVCVKRME